MGIGVEKAFLENLQEIRFQQSLGHLLGINPGRDHRLYVRNFDRFHIFQHNHPRRRMFPIYRRDDDFVTVGIHLGKSFGIVGLGHVIQLFPQRRAKLLHQGGHVGAAAYGTIIHRPPGDNVQSSHVYADNLLDIGPLHLHYYRITQRAIWFVRQQPGPVRLPQRRRRQRLFIKTGKPD